MFSEAKETEDIGNIILGVIQVVGTVVAIAILMMLGIKYMMGSVEERASYKKSMLPYLIGAILLFGAVNLTATIYSAVALDDRGSADATGFIQSVGGDIDKVEAEYRRALQELNNAKKLGEDESYIKELERYKETLYQYIQQNRKNK